MFIRLKCPSTINRGDVLSYDATSQQWTPSADGSTIIGVARTDAEGRQRRDRLELRGCVLGRDVGART